MNLRTEIYLAWIKAKPIGFVKSANPGQQFVEGFIAGMTCGESAEREACANVCEEQASEPECPERAQFCADAIRKRSNVNTGT